MCLLSKAHKFPFVLSTNKATVLFELVFIYLWISPIIFVTRAKYFLLLVDDHTKFTWIYFLNAKSQAKLALKLFKTMIER